MALYLACCPTLNRKKHTCLRNYLLTKLLHIHTYYTYTYLNDVQPLCKICNLFFLDPPQPPNIIKRVFMNGFIDNRLSMLISGMRQFHLKNSVVESSLPLLLKVTCKK